MSESGTYADETTASHNGTLTIRSVVGGIVWDTISANQPFAAQSEIGVAAIPIGFTGYILSKNIFVDTAQTADIYLMQRQFANDVIAPYKGVRRLVERDIGVSGAYNVEFKIPKGPFIGPADIGFMAEVSAQPSPVSVDFEILIIEDGF